LTLALARGARQRGATILTNTRVTGVRVEDNRVRAVETDQGTIECEYVVNAGGIYAHEIGQLAGVHVPLVAMAHQYAITKPTGLSRDMPTLRDPARLVYFRAESGGLVMGGYERNPAVWGLSGIARTSTHACWSRTGTASRRSSRPRSRECPNWPTPRS